MVLSEGTFEDDRYGPFGRDGHDDFAVRQRRQRRARRAAEYSGDYYAAFVLDLDGNNVEAVYATPK